MRDAVAVGYGGEASGGWRARNPEMEGGEVVKKLFSLFPKKSIARALDVCYYMTNGDGQPRDEPMRGAGRGRMKRKEVDIMKTEKYNDTKKITSRRKAKFMTDCMSAKSKLEVLKLAKELAEETAKRVTLEGTVQDLTLAMYACGIARRAMAEAETNEEYMKRYISWKLTTFTKLNDTGAIGDAIETAIHLIAMRQTWRTQRKNLHVSDIGKTDVKINAIRFEVGHNAKLWNDSTIDDAMSGPFDGVIYGMIEYDEMVAIAKLMRTDFVRGLTEMANMMYVFEDKNEYLEVMQNDLGRSETLKYREDLDKIVTVYNGSKQKAWINRMEGAEFPTLTEYMKALGKNDYLK